MSSGAVFACALLALLATASAQYSCQTMWQVMSTDPRLVALKNAVEYNGLKEVFDTKELPITLFAPTNDAVSVCYSAGCLNQNTLLYHVIDTAGLSALGLLSLGNMAVWQMANDGYTVISRDTAGVTTIKGINTAVVIQANIQTCGGGYIHIINAVLQPAPNPSPSPPPRPPPPSSSGGGSGGSSSGCTQSAYDVISSVNMFMPFKAFIDRAGRADYYKNTSLVATLFVPLDLNWPADQPVIAYTQQDDAFTVNTHIIPERVLPTSPGGLSNGGLLYSLSGKVLGLGLGYDDSTKSNFRLNLDMQVSPVVDAFTNLRGNSPACQYIIHGIQKIFFRQPDTPFLSPPSPAPPSPPSPPSPPPSPPPPPPSPPTGRRLA